jgi:hypothetical protein
VEVVRSLLTKLQSRRAASPPPTLTKVEGQDGQVALLDQAVVEFYTSTAPAPTQASLDRVVTGMTMFRIVPVEGSGHRLDITDAVDLLDLAACLRIVEPHERSHCMCLGSQWLEILGPEGRRALLTLHHGTRLRWEGTWNSDADLVNPHELQAKLAELGLDEPLREARRSEQRAREAEVALARWRAAMPPSLERFWEVFVDGERFWAPGAVAGDETVPLAEHALRRGTLDEGHAVRALLRWYGSGIGPWSGFPSYEESARVLLWRFSTDAIVRAIDDQPLTDEQLSGAARYFGDRDFQEHRHRDVALVPPDLRTRLLAHVEATGIEDNLATLQGAFRRRLEVVQ